MKITYRITPLVLATSVYIGVLLLCIYAINDPFISITSGYIYIGISILSSTLYIFSSRAVRYAISRSVNIRYVALGTSYLIFVGNTYILYKILKFLSNISSYVAIAMAGAYFCILICIIILVRNILHIGSIRLHIVKYLMAILWPTAFLIILAISVRAYIANKYIFGLSNSDPEIRTISLWNLRKYATSIDIKFILNRLHDDDCSVKCAAISTLVDVGGKICLNDIISLATDECGSVRVAVANSIGKLGDASSLPILYMLMKDHDNNVRHEAMLSIGQIGDENSILYIKMMYGDSDMAIKHDVPIILARMGDKDALEYLFAFKDVYLDDIKSLIASDGVEYIDGWNIIKSKIYWNRNQNMWELQ